MDISSLYSPNACDIRGKQSTDKWTWTEYFDNKKYLEAKWIPVVLVDMINHPIEGAIPISNEMFTWNQYPQWTYFCLYCHSGWSSGYVQMQLKPQLPHYNIINIEWGILMYNIQR